MTGISKNIQTQESMLLLEIVEYVKEYGLEVVLRGKKLDLVIDFPQSGASGSAHVILAHLKTRCKPEKPTADEWYKAYQQWSELNPTSLDELYLRQKAADEWVHNHD